MTGRLMIVLEDEGTEEVYSTWTIKNYEAGQVWARIDLGKKSIEEVRVCAP